MGTEYGRRRKYFIEVLELLSCPLLVRVGHCLLIDQSHIREPIHDKCPHHACLGHFILVDVDCSKVGQGLQLRNLDE